jgi:hypothetical protein
MLSGVARERLRGDVVEQLGLDEVRDAAACDRKSRELGHARSSRPFCGQRLFLSGHENW